MEKEDDRLDLRSMTLPQLQAQFLADGLPRYRADQVFQWLQQKAVADFQAMTNLPLALREQLASHYRIAGASVLRQQHSADGETHKLLLAYDDGEQVETALMLYRRQHSRNRATCCLSSQSGCAMGCAFCATGQFKQFRNLTAGEIALQAQLADCLAREQGYDGLTNLVYMGMGEPLANLEALHQSILLLNDPHGLQIGMRRITISTCGLVPQIYALSEWGWQIGLAISLHSADAQKRQRLMPGAAHYPLSELIAAAQAYRQRTGRRVTCEYALFAGVNDQEEDARKLVALLTGNDILVNIIPANPVENLGFAPSDVATSERFIAICRSAGLDVQVRESKGQDIDAACGQLRRRG